MRNKTSTILPVLSAVAAAKPFAAATVSAHRDLALSLLADAITGGAKRLIEANERDIASARKNGARDGTVEKMRLDYVTLGALCGRIRAMAAAQSPTDVSEDSISESGVAVRKMHVPLGLIAAVAGASPRRTIESAAQAVKTGNVMLIVRSALTPETDAVTSELLSSSFSCSALNVNTVRTVKYSPENVSDLLSRSDTVDALLLLASKSQNESLLERTDIPAVYSDFGATHMYIDESADAAAAAEACADSFSGETGPRLSAVLVNWHISDEFLPALEGRAIAAGIELAGDARVRSTLHGIDEVRTGELGKADGRLTVLTVNSLSEALCHIASHGDGICEGIFTASGDNAKSFCSSVDAGTVALNTSFSRINGFDAGFGADVGISSGKLGRRGVLGLDALTTVKYIIKG